MSRPAHHGAKGARTPRHAYRWHERRRSGWQERLVVIVVMMPVAAVAAVVVGRRRSWQWQACRACAPIALWQHRLRAAWVPAHLYAPSAARRGVAPRCRHRHRTAPLAASAWPLE